MGTSKVIELVAAFVIIAASTGQLPRLLCEVQTAQLQPLKASQTKSWGRALLLPPGK